MKKKLNEMQVKRELFPETPSPPRSVRYKLYFIVYFFEL